MKNKYLVSNIDRNLKIYYEKLKRPYIFLDGSKKAIRKGLVQNKFSPYKELKII